jgi:hypothetical protein
MPYPYSRRRRRQLLERADYRCQRCKLADVSWNGRSILQAAHLDGNPSNDDDSNRAILCIWCHRKHDYLVWKIRRHQTRGGQRDAARPILQLTQEVL